MYESLYTIESGGGDSPILLEALVREYFLPGGEYYDEDENFSRRAPGTVHSYSNMGFALIGYLVEHISGRDFAEFCREEIFEPLGMLHTSWRLAGLDPSSLAMPYDVTASESRAIGHYGFASYPDGQLRTTVSDYARFLATFLGSDDTLLPPASVDEFLTVQFPDVHRRQAIAWNYNEFESAIISAHIPRLPAHTGGDPGVATVAIIDPVGRSAVIVFTNGGRINLRSLKSLLDILKRLCAEAGMV